MYWNVKDIAAILEERFPEYLAEKWDNPGLQAGSLLSEVKHAVVALDLDASVLADAIDLQASLIITHHPLIFNPIRSINTDKPGGGLIAGLIKNGISLYCVHTNLDAATDGLNDWLAQSLDLQNVSVLSGSPAQKLIKLVVYVPQTHEWQVRQAITEAGAGHAGAYSDCTFRVAGIGTFQAGAGARPFIGEIGRLEEAAEFRLETIVEKQKLPGVLAALLNSHPYEEPAYDLTILENQYSSAGIGRIGSLPQPVSLGDFCSGISRSLNADRFRVTGDLDARVQRVAVVGGSGSSFIPLAVQLGAEVLVTGDVKYHEAQSAAEHGLALIDAGHYNTEIIMAGKLAGEMNELSCRLGSSTLFHPVLNRCCYVEWPLKP